MGGVDGWCMRMIPLPLSCHSLVFAWALYCQAMGGGCMVVFGVDAMFGERAGRLHKIASQIQPTRCLPLGLIGGIDRDMYSSPARQCRFMCRRWWNGTSY